MEISAAQMEYVHQARLVAKYRHEAHLSQQDLADLMEVSVHTVQRMEKQAVIKDIARRQLLSALLGIPAAYLQLDSGTEQHIKHAVFMYSDDPMSFLEDTVKTQWTLYLLGGPLDATSGLGQLVKGVESFAQGLPERGWHRRAHTQLCMVYQLQGSVEERLLHFQQALGWYQKAYTVASELNDAELLGAVRLRQGSTLLWKEQPLEAIKYLEHARDLVQGKGVPLLRGNILADLSQAYATAGQSQQCWRNLGLAEHVLEQTPQAQERSYKEFHADYLNGQKGICARILQDYDRALKLLDKSLKTYDPTRIPKHARLIISQAKAYYGQGNVDYCTDAARKAFTLATAVGAKNTLMTVKQLYTRLLHDGWERERGTAQLGMMIADYERTHQQVIPTRYV
jgi:tetratricopeptide (TPR) repeat protein